MRFAFNGRATRNFLALLCLREFGFRHERSPIAEDCHRRRVPDPNHRGRRR